MKLGKHQWEKNKWSSHTFLYLSKVKAELSTGVRHSVRGFSGVSMLYVTVAGHQEFMWTFY